ncbi:LysR family transcriptional regulator, partial [Bacillus licheniformis]|nr:LysR family transcriptional regulator [Bacillus licheniformis]
MALFHSTINILHVFVGCAQAMLERFHLVVIREVERQGSLTAAAHALHLTQSALSHTVRKIEQQLGTPIWDREGRGLRLTQGGRAVSAEAGEPAAAAVRARRGTDEAVREGRARHAAYRDGVPSVLPVAAESRVA